MCLDDASLAFLFSNSSTAKKEVLKIQHDKRTGMASGPSWGGFNYFFYFSCFARGSPPTFSSIDILNNVIYKLSHYTHLCISGSQCTGLLFGLAIIRRPSYLFYLSFFVCFINLYRSLCSTCFRDNAWTYSRLSQYSCHPEPTVIPPSNEYFFWLV
jgi:hypothetical protein